MKVIDKLIAVLALVFVSTIGGTAAHIAVVQTSAEAQTGIPLPIFMYHHILKESDRHNTYTISPEEFRNDLLYLKEQGYTPIVIQDLVDYVQTKKPLPEQPVMITFDDGYESFHEYAFPILQETGFRAVFAVVGRYADEYSQTEDHHIRYSHCTWEQLAQMQSSGLVEIQNHSYNLHTNDQGRKGSKKKPGESMESYREMLLADLGKVQKNCMEQLHWEPSCFVYPFGHISSEALPVLKEMGFSAALTCEEKINYITGEPEQLYHLYRVNRPHGKSARQILESAKK